jgi:acyl carrier protein
MLDALAQKRRFLGLPALSINWGPWSIGMVQKADLEKMFSLMGINTLTAEQGIDFLESVFYSNQPQVVVQLTEWSKFLSSSLSVNKLFANYHLFFQNDTLVNRTLSDISTIKTDLLKELAVLMNIQESAIDLSQSLTNYGMESISVMVLSDIIEERWGITISVDELWLTNSFTDLISKITIAVSGLYQEGQLIS